MAKKTKATRKLRAGAAMQSLLKDKPTSPVHDAPFARVVVFDNGKTRAAIVGTDLGGVRDELVADARRLIEEGASIPAAHVLINASHNHRTHGQVADDAAERIAQAVCKAAENMVPVKVGVARGREDGITMNRRLLLKDGRAWTIRRTNPTPCDEDVTGVGPMDSEIGVLRVDRAKGGPLAVLYNFASHPYTGVPDGGVTADMPGFASRVIEDGLGGEDAVAVFVQGAAGDITPSRYKDWHVPPHTKEYGTRLGLSVLAAAREAATEVDSRLQVVMGTVDLPRRTDLDQYAASLDAEQEEILKFYRGVDTTPYIWETSLNFKTFLPLYVKHVMDPEHPGYASYLYMQEDKIGRGDLKYLDEDNRQRIDKYLQCIHRMDRLIRLLNRRDLLQRQIDKGETGPLKAEVQAIRVGDFVLVTFPGETFCQVGLNIKKRSPFKFTFLASYTNGSIGYAPTADAYGQDAYEDTLTRLAPEWQAIYEKKALELIRKLR
jgi:hypothetical protein